MSTSRRVVRRSPDDLETYGRRRESYFCSRKDTGCPGTAQTDVGGEVGDGEGLGEVILSRRKSLNLYDDKEGGVPVVYTTRELDLTKRGEGRVNRK